MKRSQRLIPNQSFRHVVLSSIHEYISYCQDVACLPQILYTVLVVFFLFETICPFFLAGSGVWAHNETINNLLEVVSFFWRLGAIYTDQRSLLIASGVNLAIFLLCYLPAYCFCPLYQVKGQISKTLCMISIFFNDFLLQIVVFWTASQLGTIIGMSVKNGSISNSLIGFTLALALLVFLSFFYFDILLFPQVNFVNGRVLTWNGRVMSIFFILVSTNLFLTRLIELIEIPIARIIMIVAVVVVALGMIVWLSLNHWTIKIMHGAAIIGGLCAMLIVYMFVLVRLFGRDVELGMVLLLAIVLLFCCILFADYKLRKSELSMLTHLDSLEFETGGVAMSFSSLRQFLIETRVGFKNAHPYSLNFEVYKEAVETWPRSPELWMQYSRFLSVYFEQTPKLGLAAEMFKAQKFQSLHVKSFRDLLRRCLNSRSRHITRDLRDAFKVLDDTLRVVKKLLAHYWGAVENCSRGMVYDLGNQVSTKMNEIESFMNHLVVLYPNSISVCRKFGSYYGDIVCDPVREAFWKARASDLNSDLNSFVDLTQQRAFEMFTKLPRHLSGVKRPAERPDLDLSPDDLGLLSGIEDDPHDLLEAGNETSSHIRELGLHASFPFLRNLSLLLCLFFGVAFFAGSLTPAILTDKNLYDTKSYFNGVSASCRLVESLEMSATYEMAQVLAGMGALPPEIDDYVGQYRTDKADTPVYQDVLSTLIQEMNTDLNDFNEFANTEMELDSAVGQAFLQSEVGLKVADPEDATKYQLYTVTLQQGLATVVGSLGMNSPGQSLNDNRFRDAIGNAYSVCAALLEVVYLMCSDVSIWLSDAFSIVTIIVSVFAVANLILLLVTCYLIYVIFVRWTNMVRVFGSMPHVAFHKAITKFAQPVIHEANDQALLKEEVKCSDKLEEIISTRSLRHGLPIGLLTGAVVINAVLSAVVLLTMALTVKGFTGPLLVIPFRVYYTSDFAKGAFRSAQILLRILTQTNGNPFWYDTRTSLEAGLLDALERTVASLNAFLISDTEGLATGVLSSTKEIVNSLLVETIHWPTESLEQSEFRVIPRLIAMDVMVEVLTRLYSCFETKTDLESSEISQYLVRVLNYLCPRVLDIVSASYAQLTDATIAKRVMTVYVIAAVFLVLGFVMLLIILWQINGIRRTMRFCLSALSMIDFRFLRDSPCVMALLSGNYGVSLTENDILMPFVLEVDDTTTDAVIFLNDALRITWYNKVACDSYRFDAGVMNTHIRAALRFSNKEILRSLEELVSYGRQQEKLQTEFESVVYFYSSEYGKEEEQKELVKLVSARQHKKNEVALIMTHRDEVQGKLDETRAIYREIEALQKSVMPKQLDGVIGLDSTVELRGVIVVSIQLCDDRQMCKGGTATEVHALLHKFQSLVDEAAAETDDATRLEDLGFSAFVCFNIIKQRTNMVEIAAQALDFCRLVADLCRQAHLVIKAGMGYDSVCCSGLVSSDRLKFDVFGAAGKQAYYLARQAGPFQVIPNKRICDFMSTEALRSSSRVHLSLMWQASDWYQVLNI